MKRNLIMRSVRLVYEAAPLEARLVVVFSAISAGAGFAEILLLRSLVESFTGNSGIKFDAMLRSGIGLVLAMSVAALAASLQRNRSQLFSELVSFHAYLQILRTSAAVEPAAFDDPSFLDRMQRASSISQSRPKDIAQGLVQTTAALAGTVALGSALAILAPVLLPILALAGLPVLLASRRTNLDTYNFSRSTTESDRHRAFASTALTVPDFAREAAVIGSGEFFVRRYATLTSDRLATLRQLVVHRTRRVAFAEAASSALFLITFIVVAILIHDGSIDIATASAALAVAFGLRMRMTGLGAGSAQLGQSLMYIADYFEFIDDQSIIVSPSVDGSKTGRAVYEDSQPPEIRLLGVSFSYPGTSVPALSDIDICLPAGKLVALVGENGAGKTTVAKLVAGLYEASTGRVEWDGSVVSKASLPLIRSQVSVVFQNFLAYGLTGRENVALSDWARVDAQDDVRAAALAAGADEFLSGLANGYETILSKQFSGGTDLSVGQWQRIALARAYFRNSPVLVLDEPTSALDAFAERQLLEHVLLLAKRRTVLLVTHDLATARHADCIYVMEHGRVAEYGRHRDLLAHSGLYAAMWRMQDTLAAVSE